MTEKTGRNDPCPCGSGKKYKQCCLLKKQAPLGQRKFKAKVISAGGMAKPQEQTTETQQQVSQAAFDYNALMERSFGNGINAPGEKPPLPANPSDYLAKEEEPS